MFRLTLAHLFLGMCLALTAVPARAGVLFEFTNLLETSADNWSIDVVARKFGDNAPPSFLGASMVAEFSGINGVFSRDFVPSTNGIGSNADFKPADQVDLGTIQVHGIWFFQHSRSYEGKTLFTFRFSTTETPTLTSIKAAYPSDPSMTPSYTFYPGVEAPGETIEQGTPVMGYRNSETVPEPFSICVFIAPAAMLFRRARRQVKPTELA